MIVAVRMSGKPSKEEARCLDPWAAPSHLLHAYLVRREVFVTSFASHPTVWPWRLLLRGRASHYRHGPPHLGGLAIRRARSHRKGAGHYQKQGPRPLLPSILHPSRRLPGHRVRCYDRRPWISTLFFNGPSPFPISPIVLFFSSALSYVVGGTDPGLADIPSCVGRGEGGGHLD